MTTNNSDTSARREAQELAYQAMESYDQDEAMSPVAGEIAMNRMQQALEGKKFSSNEELNSFIQEISQQQNNEPIDDFEGLSAEQMHRLINFPFDSPEVVGFPSPLSAPPSAPITSLFAMLADAIGEDGLKPTAKGNLPLKVVREIALNFMGEDEYVEYTKYGDIRSEEGYRELNVTRIVAELAGLIRKSKGKFILRVKCRKLLKDGGLSAIYPALFRAFSEKYNWAYSDCYPEIGRIQDYFAYTLYLLDRHGDTWQSNNTYADAFIKAFPALLKTVEPNTYKTQEDIIRTLYSLRCLSRFAEYMGLIETQRDPEDYLKWTFKLRKTPLLGEVVSFKSIGAKTTLCTKE